MAVGISVRGKVAATSFAFFCASLLLTAYSARNPWLGRAGGIVVAELLAPFNSLVEFTHSFTRTSWDRYIYLVGVEAQNEELLAHMRELEGDLAVLNEFRSENERLRRVLNFAEDFRLEGVMGTVIGNDPSSWVNGVVINKGSLDGIKVGMAAVHARGVVGQVIAVSPRSSRLLLISDHSSGVDAIVQGSRVRGVVEGSGSQVCQLRYGTREVPVKTGDVILTSGMDGVFPKGLIIGTVTAVESAGGELFQSVLLKPAVDFARLEEVLVVTKASPLNGDEENVGSADRRLKGAQ